MCCRARSWLKLNRHKWTLTWFVIRQIQSDKLSLETLLIGGANEAVIRMLISIGKYVERIHMPHSARE
jgi:hypothetical protein